MKFVGLGLLLVPLVCSASEPLIPMAEGTTWNYDLLQERPSDSLDLTEPNEQEHIAVTYRAGGNEKVDGKDLRRLEIYRGDTLENIDLAEKMAERMEAERRRFRARGSSWASRPTTSISPGSTGRCSTSGR